MKKILLLIVSGLLIACMAGSAMANPDSAQIWDATGENRVDLIGISLLPGETKDFTLWVELSPSATDQTFEYATEVTGASGGGTVDQITITTPDTFTVPANLAVYKDIGNIHITLSNSAPIGAKYTFTVGGKHFVVARATVSSVPEFPTVALPVAAILGLVFIFGRRKEGL